MLGQSKTALLTFEGDTVPRAVYFYGGELLCYHYRKTRQACQNCMTAGHRSDVCPTPQVSKCPQCGTANPAPEHPCSPKCALCGEEGHVTGTKDCKKKFRNSRIPPGNIKGKAKKPNQPRWFPEEWPTLDQTTDPPVRNNTEQATISSGNEAPTGNKTTKDRVASQERKQEGNKKVSWPKVAASLQNTNTKIDSLQSKQDKVIEELRAQLARQNNEIENLRRQLSEKEKRSESPHNSPAISTGAFTPKDMPAPIPQPPVPPQLLNDPSGIGLFLAQMQQALNNRMDQIQQALLNMAKPAEQKQHNEAKRKLEQQLNPRESKQQALDAQIEDLAADISDKYEAP